jgi:hypothetical protein
MSFGTARDSSLQVAAIPMTSFGKPMNSPHSEFRRISPQKTSQGSGLKPRINRTSWRTRYETYETRARFSYSAALITASSRYRHSPGYRLIRHTRAPQGLAFETWESTNPKSRARPRCQTEGRRGFNPGKIHQHSWKSASATKSRSSSLGSFVTGHDINSLP